MMSINSASSTAGVLVPYREDRLVCVLPVRNAQPSQGLGGALPSYITPLSISMSIHVTPISL